MNAVEFVKKVGISVATDLFKKSEGCDGIRPAIGGYVKRDDLKQIVEAWGLVDQYHGINGAKVKLKSLHDESSFKGILNEAINLVEQLND